MTVSRPGAGLIAAAAVGLALLAALAAGLGLFLRSEALAVRAGQALQRALAMAGRFARRPPPCDVPGSLLGFRDRAAGLLAARGWRITAATAVSQLALWLVLLTHRSFTAAPALRVALAIAGSMSVQGEVIGWVAIHPRHHAFTDRPGDPHSPYRYGTSVGGQLRGLALADPRSPRPPPT